MPTRQHVYRARREGVGLQVPALLIFVNMDIERSEVRRGVVIK